MSSWIFSLLRLKQKQHPLLTLRTTPGLLATVGKQRRGTVCECGWASSALGSVKEVIHKATHCVTCMILWESQNYKGRKQTTLLAGPAGEPDHKVTEEFCRTIKLFSVPFLIYIAQLYIFATTNRVVSEKGFIFLCSYFTSTHLTDKKKKKLHW